MQGLYERSHLTVSPLRKISLGIELGEFSMGDFRGLWDAIFSLQELEKLEIGLGKELTDMTRQLEFKDVIYESWAKIASNKQLKSILLTAPKASELDFRHMSVVAQTYSFTQQMFQRPRVLSDFLYEDDWDYI